MRGSVDQILSSAFTATGLAQTTITGVAVFRASATRARWVSRLAADETTTRIAALLVIAVGSDVLPAAPVSSATVEYQRSNPSAGSGLSKRPSTNALSAAS